MKPNRHYSKAHAILAGTLAFAGSVAATPLFTEDFEGDASKWNEGAVWGIYNSSDDYSDSDHFQIPDGGSFYGNLIVATGASLDGGPATATINITGLTPEEDTALAAGNAFWSFDVWLASWTGNDEYTVFTAEWFDGSDGTGNSLGTSTLADGGSTNGVTRSIQGFDPPSADTPWSVKNWSNYLTSGNIPAGAASLVLSYEGIGGGNNNDAYADLIKLDLTTVNILAYAGWAASNGLDGSPGKEAGFGDNPDNDGFSNGLEWILGGNPLTGDDSSLLSVSANSTEGITLNFTRDEISIDSSTLAVEWSTDLSSPWNTIPIGAITTEPDANGAVVTIDDSATPDQVTVTIPASNQVAGKIFVRLRATQ